NMSKIRISNLFPAIPIALVLAGMMFSHSCANTTTPPSGGPKDTIPPVIKKIIPEDGTVFVPAHKTKLEFGFNEYVVVKDAQSIYLSPPQEKAPKYKIKGKSVIVYFEKDLDSNTTYTLDLTNAIADNNEGNMFPGYTLTFSTGSRIDSMMMTGTVLDCNTLMPVKGATVMLYAYQGDSTFVNDTLKVPTDSLPFLRRPDAAVKTDDWGYFCLRNIRDTLYRLYALMDENRNNKYDPDNDRIAFLDTVIRPTVKVNDSLPELQKYLMTDTLACLARKSEHELHLFKETPSKQMIVNKERLGERTAYITFMAPYAQVDSLWFKGIPSRKVITQFNIKRDSLEIWINDPKPQPDTLFLNVSYLKTDSLWKLSPTVEEIKLSKPRKSLAAKSSKRDLKHEDTIAVFTTTAQGETVEQYGIEIEFKYPVVKGAFDSLEFRYLNPRQQESKGKYNITQDSLNLRKYVVRPEVKFMPGYEYFLKIPHRKFQDINGFWNDSTEVKVSLPNDDKLSSVNLVLSGVHNFYIVDLLNEKRDKVLRSYRIDKDCTLPFPYLKAGKYSIRITEDVNGNGIVDTGNLLSHKQPEKVRFYKLKDGTFLIDIPEMTELDQDINIEELFR
ncbi:MAG: Ig-like domain-containing protein, partial [Candidatus Cryptobacteroides sp.]